MLVQNPLANCQHGRSSTKLVNNIVRMGSRWHHNQKTEEVKELIRKLWDPFHKAQRKSAKTSVRCDMVCYALEAYTFLVVSCLWESGMFTQSRRQIATNHISAEPELSMLRTRDRSLPTFWFTSALASWDGKVQPSPETRPWGPNYGIFRWNWEKGDRSQFQGYPVRITFLRFKVSLTPYKTNARIKVKLSLCWPN